MANKTITANPEEVTATDALESVCTIGYSQNLRFFPDIRQVTVEVITGTIRFNANGNGADGAPLGVGEKATFTVKDKKFNFIAAAGTDKFRVTTS